jgi:hypothetical protein
VGRKRCCSHQEGEALFLCECARQDCTERLTVSLGPYEEVRQVPTHFLVAAGHEHVFPDAERLFETHNGYRVVEKFGEARIAAIKLDPRRRNGEGDLQAPASPAFERSRTRGSSR